MLRPRRSTKHRRARGVLSPWLTHLLLILVLAIAIAATACVAILHSNWPELLRRLAVVQLRISLKRDVRLERLALDPRGRIVLTNLLVTDSSAPHHTLFSVRQVVIRFNPAHWLLAPGKPISAMRQIVLDHPVLSLARHDDGTMNIDDLLQQKQPSGDTFHGELFVREGELFYHDAHGWLQHPPPFSEHLVHLTALLLHESDTYLPFHLTAMTASGDARHLDINGGLRLDSHTIGCEVCYRDINLPYIQRILPVHLPLTFASGQVDGRWQLILLPDPQTGKLHWRVTLAADIRNAHGMLALFHQVPYTITQAHIRVADIALQLDDVRGVIAGVSVEVNGSIANLTGSVYTLQLQTTGADTRSLIRQIPGLARLPFTWGGKTDVWAQLTGPVNALQVIGHFRDTALFAGFGRFTHLSGDFSYMEHALRVANLSGEAFAGQFAGSLWMSLPSPASRSILLTGQVTHLDLHQLVAQFLTPAPSAPTAPSAGSAHALRELQGMISGPVTIKVTQQDSVTVLLHGHGPVEAPALARGDVAADVQLEVTHRGFTARIARAEAKLPEGYFQAQGQVSSLDGMHLTVRGDMLNLHLLGMRAHQANLSGTGYVLGEIAGPLAHPVFAGTLQAKDGSVAGHAFSDFTAECAASLGSSPSIRLSKMQLLTVGNQWQLDGLTLTNFNTPRWIPSGTLLLHPTTLEALQALTGLPLPLHGVVEGAVHFRGAGAPPEGTVLLHHPWLTIGKTSLELDNAVMHFTVANSVLEITDAALHYHGATFSVSGTLPLDTHTLLPQGMALKVNAHDLDADDFTALVACDSPRAGQFTGDARLQLPLDVAGHFTLNASLSARLAPGAGATSAELLARTLAVQASVDGADSLSIAGIRYQHASAMLAYDGETHSLALSSLDITRQNGNGQYHLTLAEPATLDLDSQEIDLHAVLQGVRTAEHGAVSPCDLECLRRDLVTIADNTLEDSAAFDEKSALLDESDGHEDGTHRLPAPFDQVEKTLKTLPQPFSGRALCKIALSGALRQPLIALDLACQKMVVGGDAAPDLEGSLAYDPAPRTITIDHLQADGPDAHEEAEVSGTITLPMRDLQGQELNPGLLNLSASLQHFNPSLLGTWMRIAWLRDLHGDATVVATINATTDSPHILASVDITGAPGPETVGFVNPSYKSLQFDAFSAIVSLDEQGIWLGRWVKMNPAEEVHADTGQTGMHTVQIGDRMIAADAGATLQFKGAVQAPIQPLEMIGHLPLRWKGTLAPYIPTDEPIFFAFHLPRQGLDIVRSLLPQPPASTLVGSTPGADDRLLCAFKQGTDWSNAFRIYLTKPAEQAGTVEGSLEIQGTLTTPRVDNGTFHIEAPELRFATDDADLPNRMRETMLDLEFSSTGTGDHRVNLIKVNDLSTIFDRSDKPEANKASWIDHLLNRHVPPPPPIEGALVAQGTIRIDPRSINLKNLLPSLVDARGNFLPASLFDQLDYDLYAKTVRTPLRWRNLFKGTMTGYVRLGNAPDTLHQPQLTGVIYLEKAQVTNGELSAPSGKFTFPFNPQLSLALQIGPNDVFKLGEQSSASRILQSEFTFTPTRLFPPFSQSDQAFARAGDIAKPAVERNHPAYRYTENTLQNDDGSHGSITGTLASPVIKADFMLNPDQSQIQLPGGVLTVEDGHGSLRYAPNDVEPLHLYVQRGYATGYLNDFKIAAEIDNTDLLQLDKPLAIHFTTLSGPAGVQPPDDKEIAMELLALNNVQDSLQGKQPIFTPLYTIGQTYLIQGMLGNYTKDLGLETFNVNMNTGEAMLTTQEFGLTKWSALRFGTSRVLSNPPAWKVWLDYRLPDARFLRNFSITAQTDQLSDTSVVLRYQWPF